MRVPAGSVISGDPPPAITVAPGETVVRELRLNDVYSLTENPRNTDVLLLWSSRRDQSPRALRYSRGTILHEDAPGLHFRWRT
jgi:hypothetical protein